jgi:hypothetical protein
MRKIDRSSLSLDHAEDRGIIHRDYIAHCHRWSFALKQAIRVLRRDGYLSVLDVGCGKEVPFLKTLYVNKACPDFYMGVEYNKMDVDMICSYGPRINEKVNDGTIRILEETNFALIGNVNTYPEFTRLAELRPFNLIISFEVLEHMERSMSRMTLKNINDLIQNPSLTNKPICLVSTPVYDPYKGMAANHINEMTRGELIYDIFLAGMEVRAVYGTFMDQVALINATDVDDPVRIVFDQLKDYYDPSLLATIFAPLYPQHARNNLWVLDSIFDNVNTFDNTKVQQRMKQGKYYRELVKVLKEEYDKAEKSVAKMPGLSEAAKALTGLVLDSIAERETEC